MAKKVKFNFLTFEILTAVTVQPAVLWNVTPCNLAKMCQRFGGTFCLLLQGKTESCEFKGIITWEREKRTGAVGEP
jgi:hypothetical protein